MHPINAIELLNFWEHSINHTQIQRAIDLLCCASPEMNAEEVALLSIGERDSRLLLLREWLFGTQLQNMAECSACSERNEWETEIKNIRMQNPNPDKTAREMVFEKDGYSVLFRLPNSYDLSEAIEFETGNITDKLLNKLIIDCKYNNKPMEINTLPDIILDELDLRIAEANPQAEILMHVKCVNCNHEWDIQFDIVSYLWIEISNWARYIFNDIAILASTYGWSEHDILSMSPARRQIYLDMA